MAFERLAKVELVGTVLSYGIGIVGVAAGFTITSLLLYPNFAIPFRLISLRVSELARTLLPTLSCTALMFASLALADLLLAGHAGHTVLLALLVPLGAASYTVFTWFLNRPMLHELLATAGIRKTAANLS